MAKRWLSAGHAVEWLCGSFRGAPRHEIVDGIRVTRVGNAMTVYGALPLEYLRSFRDRFDVIIDAENGIPFFSPLFSLKPKICLVHHVHKDVFKQHLPLLLAQVLTWMECRLMPRLYRTGRFVAVSEDTRSAMRDIGIPGQSIDVVRNGVDAGLLPGAKFAQPTIVYLGRLKRYKRIDHIIDALARVRAVLPDAVLHIAGDGDDRARLQSYAGARGLEDAVVFEGFVDENRKLRLLQGSWIFVSASEIEGWGISVAEANACGTPAVSYSVPGLREVIINGFNGFTIAQGGDLAEPILDVLRDCDMRSRLEAGAVRRAAEFSWDQSAEMMMEVIVRTVVGDRFGLVKMRGRWNFVTSSVSTDGALEAVQKVLV